MVNEDPVARFNELQRKRYGEPAAWFPIDCLQSAPPPRPAAPRRRQEPSRAEAYTLAKQLRAQLDQLLALLGPDRLA